MIALLRQLGVVAVAAAACVIVFIALRGPNGVPSMLEKRNQIEQMRQENDQIRQEIDKHQRAIEQLESSPEARDRAVRVHTKQQKANEIKVVLDGNETKK